ncbi:hypothetical protein, variant 2 [Aphanomyces invadans]|nr:hypothetical protein H310_06482 [Aphanomyces invadans]XP_008869797.1 hypothetical protein, variant 1 [Aphanomyces invadans]XP_008869798.1 hypothetical protein, variant 2 [Aphanomyces invadans]ETW01948.1 hypothetical protein H310_06482 [Aphanomyces invadans]ETW01949.1 hypothetical protein, variant 1 [Aphanomyces invadans]ETW01950.1 hypothetical protein, variant 2 [Aphanomyces invadans]|eukprot:XP_008869796.1 hypothetical protein H310_06482 [Aphanomyces invadans]
MSAPASPPPTTTTPQHQETSAVSERERGYYLPEGAEEERKVQEPASSPDAATKKRKIGEVDSTLHAHHHSTIDAEAEGKAIARLLSPFTREQIVSILISAALQHKSIYNEIRSMASVDVAHRKLFVRGLSWDTTTATMQQVFESFGKIEECTVIMDRNTGKSKGFGFVTYEDMESAERVLSVQPLEIDGRKCACNLAAVPENNPNAGPVKHNKPAHAPSYSQQYQQHQAPTYGYAQPPMASKVLYADLGPPGDESDRKLFLRGLDYNTTTESVTVEFQKYGDLEEVTIAKDRATGKSKGYAFIVYRHMGGAKRALAQPQKFIDGRATHCNLASQKNSNAGAQYGGHTPAPTQQPYRPPAAAAVPQVIAYPPHMYQQPAAATAYMGYAPAAPYGQPQEMYMMAAPQYAQQPMQPPPPTAYYHHPPAPANPAGGTAAAKPSQ